MKNKNWLRAFSCALTGLVYAVCRERNMRVHLTAAFAAAFLGWQLALSAAEFAILAVTIGMVLVAELINTAIEAVVDLASPEIHPLAKRAKDVAAGAVLVSSIIAIIVGLFLFGPRIVGQEGFFWMKK